VFQKRLPITGKARSPTVLSRSSSSNCVVLSCSVRLGDRSVETELDEVETRYQSLVAGSCDLLAKLDSAVQCSGVYDGLAGEVGRALTEVESVVQQSAASAAVPDNEFDVQHQLDLVTTTAQRVAGLGKVYLLRPPCFPAGYMFSLQKFSLFLIEDQLSHELIHWTVFLVQLLFIYLFAKCVVATKIYSSQAETYA